LVDTFAPQFLLLVGINIFLGGSILSVMLDDHFPKGLPYILDIGSFVGFSELLVGPQFTASFSQTLQFYYCLGYLAIGVLSIVGLNLYLLIAKQRLIAGALIALVATTPAILLSAFFASTYVNGVPLGLPIIPVLPMSAIYALFAITGIIIVLATIMAVPNLREKVGLVPKRQLS
jgi:hypothetical protein